MSNQAVINEVLSDLDINPIMLDIGASAAPPKIWSALSHRSTYIGFDPDRREIHEDRSGAFQRSIIVNEALTANKDASEVTFYLTKSPFCSSTLEPDPSFVNHWIISDYFDVEKKTKARATTIDSVMKRLKVDHVDWIKTDSQGTDLRLFNSIAPEVRTRVLALDIEPGLIEIYKGEDLFFHVHADLTRNGFWLSDFYKGAFLRMRRDSLKLAQSVDQTITEAAIKETVRGTPAYLDSRYLRTLEWLAEKGLSRREYALLWVFSIVDNQLGFALDLCCEFERIFGNDALSKKLKSSSLALLKSAIKARQKRKKLEPIESALRTIGKRIIHT